MKAKAAVSGMMKGRQSQDFQTLQKRREGRYGGLIHQGVRCFFSQTAAKKIRVKFMVTSNRGGEGQVKW